MGKSLTCSSNIKGGKMFGPQIKQKVIEAIDALLAAQMKKQQSYRLKLIKRRRNVTRFRQSWWLLSFRKLRK